MDRMAHTGQQDRTVSCFLCLQAIPWELQWQTWFHLMQSKIHNICQCLYVHKYIHASLSELPFCVRWGCMCYALPAACNHFHLFCMLITRCGYMQFQLEPHFSWQWYHSGTISQPFLLHLQPAHRTHHLETFLEVFGM